MTPWGLSWWPNIGSADDCQSFDRPESRRSGSRRADEADRPFAATDAFVVRGPRAGTRLPAANGLESGDSSDYGHGSRRCREDAPLDRSGGHARTDVRTAYLVRSIGAGGEQLACSSGY